MCYLIAEQILHTPVIPWSSEKGFQIVEHMCMECLYEGREDDRTQIAPRLGLVRASQVLFVAIKNSMWLFLLVFYYYLYFLYA